jgi:anti-sigma regulatory factor (Ser/Thr protein kinase)
MGAKVADVVRPDRAVARFGLEAEPRVVAEGREHVEETLVRWSLHQFVEDVKLIASELISNAVNATPGERIWLVLCHEGGSLAVGVWDSSPDPPRMSTCDPYDESGRGLHIVAALAEEHGSHPVADPKGKLVWARLKI